MIRPVTIPGSQIFFFLSHIFTTSQCISGYFLGIDYDPQGLLPTVLGRGKHLVFLNQSREEILYIL